MQVNAARAEQEEEVKHKLKEAYYSYKPLTLIKRAFKNKNQEAKNPKKLTQSVLTLGTNFLIGKVLKRGLSVKGYLLSLAMEKVADYALSGKSTIIRNGVNKLGGLIKKIKS